MSFRTAFAAPLSVGWCGVRFEYRLFRKSKAMQHASTNDLEQIRAGKVLFVISSAKLKLFSEMPGSTGVFDELVGGHITSSQELAWRGRPLIRHCIRDALKGFRAFFPADRFWKHKGVIAPLRITTPVGDGDVFALDDFRRYEFRQTLEPETSGLHLMMAVVVRLDYLVRLSPHRGKVAYGVLHSHSRDIRVVEFLYESYGLLTVFFSQPCFVPVAFFIEPDRARGSEISTRRVSYHQIPAVADDVEYVALIVRTRNVGRQKVAGQGIVSALQEGVTDSAGVFTGYEHFHKGSISPRSLATSVQQSVFILFQ